MIHHNFSYDSHPGNLPIRVFQKEILKYVENLGELTPEKHKRYVDKGVISDCIEYNIAKEIIAFPHIKIATRTIFVQETFLAYLWCFCYSFLVITEEGIKQNNDLEKYKIVNFNTDILQNALKLLYWTISLKNNFSEWPPNLPNPEFYQEIDKFYIESANGLFRDAFAFCFLHEMSHAINGHIENTCSDNSKEIENEADNYAISLMLNNTDDENHKFKVAFACILAMCACLPITSKRNLASSTHPGIDTRIVNLVEKFGLENGNHVMALKSTVLNTFTVFKNIHGLCILTDLNSDIDQIIDHHLFEFDRLKN